MQLSKNFSLDELTHSNTAIAHNIPNIPDDTTINNLKALVENVLQPLRDLIGPIHIDCGYRCPEVNKLVGGVPTSQHCFGQASDLSNGPANNKLIYDTIIAHLPFDQVIVEGGTFEEPAWIHVSYSTTHNRKQKLSHIHGQSGYVPIA